ncbi:MAG: BatA domain-containing protein, partial [Bradymonadaceae bacterium]
MSFVEPLYLLGLLAAGLPIAIHLINRRQAVRQRFPALRLLRESDRKEARSIKVRRWLLMLLRVLAVALLALALAKPYVYSEAAVGSDTRLPEAVVLVADDSLSMRNDRWWKRAKRRLNRELDALKPWDKVALLRTTAPDEGPVARLVDDKDEVRTELQSLEPTGGTGDLPAALVRADELLSGSELPNKRIVAVSDFARGGFPDGPGSSAAVEHPVDTVRIGASDERANLAVTGIDYRKRGAAGENTWEFAADIRNYGTEDAEGVELQLSV